MGNEQSAPAPRRPTNKLSKPRTNAYSNSNQSTSKLSASAPATRRNSVSTNYTSPIKRRENALLPQDVMSEAGGCAEVKEEKKKRRMSLFRSKSSKNEKALVLTVAREMVENPVEVQETRWARPARSRVNSMLSEREMHQLQVHEVPADPIRPPFRKRLSQPQYPSHNQRLSLVAELPSSKPEETDSQTFPRLEPHLEDIDTLGMGQRSQSEAQLYVPIRRRSLLQHGVATRASYTEAATGPLPPKKQMTESLHDYHCDTPKPATPPLVDLATLRSEWAVPGPRVETPTELDYGHIGAFKLGTLRITNGSVSPAPSFELVRANTMAADDDYLTMGARRSAESTRRHAQNQRSNTVSIPSQGVRAPWVVRAESPLRHTHGASEVMAEKTASEHKPLTVDTHVALDPSFALFNFKGDTSPTLSLDLATAYQKDLALSPFSFTYSPAPSPLSKTPEVPAEPLSAPKIAPLPRLEATSKHMAVEDDLFEAEPATPTLPDRAPRSFDSGYEGAGLGLPPQRETSARSVTPKGPREPSLKPLAKADSGYSSGASLRSFKKDARSTPVIEHPASMENQRDPAMEIRPGILNERTSSGTYSVNSIDTLPSQQPRSRCPSSTRTEEWPQLTERVPLSVYSVQSIEAAGISSQQPISRVPSSTYSVAANATEVGGRPQPTSRVPSSTYSIASHSTETAGWRPQPSSRAPSSTYSTTSDTIEITRKQPSRVPSRTCSQASAESSATLKAQRSLPSLPKEDEWPAVPQRKAPTTHPIYAPNNSLYGSGYSSSREFSPPVPEKQVERTSIVPLTNTHSRQKSLTTLSRSGWDSSPAVSEKSDSSRPSLWRSSSKPPKRPTSLQSLTQSKTREQGPAPVYTVQALRPSSTLITVPVPSAEARKHLDQRVDNFPVVNFPNTLQGNLGNFRRVRKAGSKETLGTIFSVGSMEVREELSFARLHEKLPAAPPGQDVNRRLPAVPTVAADSLVLSNKPEYGRRSTYQVVRPSPLTRAQTAKSWEAVPRETQPMAPSLKPLLQKDQDFESQFQYKPSQDSESSLTRANIVARHFGNDATQRIRLPKVSSSRERNVLSQSSETLADEEYSETAREMATATTAITREHSRSMRGAPPQAHRTSGNFNAPQSLPSQQKHYPELSHLRREGRYPGSAEDESRLAALSTRSLNKTKSPPPVSMTTRRKGTPTGLGSHIPLPNSTAPPIGVLNILPRKPVPITKDENKGMWSKTASNWRARRKSAGEALGKKSTEQMNRRPSLDQHQQFLSCNSSHGKREPEQFEGYLDTLKVDSLQQTSSTEYIRPQASFENRWNVGVGFNSHDFDPTTSGLEFAPARPKSTQPRPKPKLQSQQPSFTRTQTEGEYNHSFGRIPSPNQQARQRRSQKFAEEYESREERVQEKDIERIHEKQNSTSNMLVLDRYGGGLEYGFEPGYGVGGSAGQRPAVLGKSGGPSRKSVEPSLTYGVDFSDIPVFLTRVQG